MPSIHCVDRGPTLPSAGFVFEFEHAQKFSTMAVYPRFRGSRLCQQRNRAGRCADRRGGAGDSHFTTGLENALIGGIAPDLEDGIFSAST